VRKIPIDKQFLEKEYVCNKKALWQIAYEIGVNRQTIANKLNNITLRLEKTR
jgi:DNA-binding CsgD family transcriptional regulator